MIKPQQQGLSNLVALIILAVSFFLIGAGGYFLWADSTRQAQPVSRQKQPVKTKQYTDSTQLYSIAYPADWTLQESEDCCEGPPKDYTKVSRSFRLIPPGVKNKLQGVAFQADRTDALAKMMREGWKNNKDDPKPVKTNGYPAEYAQVNFKTDAERYIRHEVLITNNGASVLVTFQPMHKHPMSGTDYDHTKYIDEFSDILNSIKFRN